MSLLKQVLEDMRISYIKSFPIRILLPVCIHDYLLPRLRLQKLIPPSRASPNTNHHAPTLAPPPAPRPHRKIPHNHLLSEGVPPAPRCYRPRQSNSAMETRFRAELLNPNRHPDVRTQVEGPPIRACCRDSPHTLLHANAAHGAE